MKLIQVILLFILSSCNIVSTDIVVEDGFIIHKKQNKPVTLSIVSPNSTSGMNPNPIVRVHNVKIGDTVMIYSDVTCSTQLNSSVAVSSNIDIQASGLSGGLNTFYANTVDAEDNYSACTTHFASYTYIPCPANWIWVEGNSELSTNDFCVMKFEAKNNSTVATSMSSSTPWVSINQPTAQTKCSSLGTGFTLISNLEWMTIARSIENTSSNWSGSCVGCGMINRGHTDSAPGSILAVADVGDSYIGTGNNSGEAAGSGWEQKRTHTLSNGEVIWDFAVNATEWVDWIINSNTDKAYVSGDGTVVNAYREFSMLNMAIGNGLPMETRQWQPDNPSFNSAQAMGQYYSGTTAPSGAVRGGAFNMGSQAGIYFLILNFLSSATSASTSFRCVYQP